MILNLYNHTYGIIKVSILFGVINIPTWSRLEASGDTPPDRSVCRTGNPRGRVYRLREEMRLPKVRGLL